MAPNLSRKVALYVSCHDGKIEIAEINSTAGTAFSASANPVFFACGSADSKPQAEGIRDNVAESKVPGEYWFQLPNGKMTDEKRREIVKRVEAAYQDEANARGGLSR